MQRSTGRSVAGDEEQNRDTIPTPRFARGSSVKNSFIAAEGECSHNIMADQQRNQELGTSLDKFPGLSTFSLGDKIQNRGRFLFKISRGSNAVDHRSEMVDSVDDF